MLLALVPLDVLVSNSESGAAVIVSGVGCWRELAGATRVQAGLLTKQNPQEPRRARRKRWLSDDQECGYNSLSPHWCTPRPCLGSCLSRPRRFRCSTRSESPPPSQSEPDRPGCLLALLTALESTGSARVHRPRSSRRRSGTAMCSSSRSSSRTARRPSSRTRRCSHGSRPRLPCLQPAAKHDRTG